MRNGYKMKHAEATDLAALILNRKGDRSYERLSRDCGGRPSANRLQQIASAPLTAFPSADTIRSLSLGLGATITDVTMASARSIGLNVRADDPDALTLVGAGELPEELQNAIVALVRQIQLLQAKGRDTNVIDFFNSPPTDGSDQDRLAAYDERRHHDTEV